ncbi:MAG: putative EAL-domain containing protein YkuI [Rhodocyclaceae bacterium]|jgi:EAL domain-containing protein (putative c-di-GMP-specific phosphodiesterase class I)|nr:putative EAL-domain containing protein YkuI [Rhodocyclaceae bacterium]
MPLERLSAIPDVPRIVARDRDLPVGQAANAADGALADLVRGQQGYWARYKGLKLTSHFQPIYSLSHCRPIGHEGLLRAFDGNGLALSPASVIGSTENSGELQYLDRLCRFLHVANYDHLDADGLLFLNVHPEIVSSGPDGALGEFLPELIEGAGLSPARIVIEVMEQAVEDDCGFAKTLDYMRDLGCLIAMDDFGAGHSNFDRIWTLKPDLVKLDRGFALRVMADSRAHRLLPQIAGFIHEAGALVLLEGVETCEQATLALDADVDFVQGYYFGMPAPRPVSTDTAHVAIEELWHGYSSRQLGATSRYREAIAPYERAIYIAAMRLQRGKPMAESCAGFHTLAWAQLCYLLDGSGWQIGPGLTAPQSDAKKSGMGIDNALPEHTCWSRRPYFRRAVQHPEKVQVSRPYLSLSSGKVCVTVSIAFRHQGELRVLCGDLALPDRY